MRRLHILTGVFATALAGCSALAQDTRFPPLDQQIPGPPCLLMRGEGEPTMPPCSDEMHEAWLRDVTHWRSERLVRVGYSDELYTVPALQWTQSSFIQPQMMVEDRYIYDPATRNYTVDRYLDDLVKRYGGIDAVLVWPTYPNLGIDNRNQLDMVQAMPGGLDGVRQMVADFHRRGVRVLFPMMMWDQGTREPSASWPEELAALMKKINADGINGDTQDGVPFAFSSAAVKIGHPLAFEPEVSPHDEALAWNVLTWGQYLFTFEPKVDRFKWLETRHMVNISDRWNRTKTDDLQSAFFNGVGWESWENIWGIWNGITPRDAERTRQVATLERGVAPFLISKEWEPYYPTIPYGIFASRWPLGDRTVWTIVNRNEYNIESRQFLVPAKPGVRYFDLYHGVELKPEHEGNQDALTFAIGAHGFAAIAALPGEPDSAMTQLMATMKQLTATPLSAYSDEWKVLAQQMVPIEPTKPVATAPSDMVRIPEGDFLFRVEGIEVEGDDDIGVDVQYPWEDAARRFHNRRMHVKPFYMDKYPVTNAQFAEFVRAAKYHPADDLNFLKDWKSRVYPTGWGNKPVTWVSLEDARAYAAWAGKRLPHEWEWQYAAQGDDERLYPWGNAWRSASVPVPDQSRTLRGPDAVDAHPDGSSPFGVMDLVGNVWQWTDEYLDEHTRAAIVRGGSYYQPQGSKWYFPQAYQNDQHGKLLLMAPSKDRAGTLGFRCVQDAE
jgi:formylglycine-generating enzyme required for sulfatase activity